MGDVLKVYKNLLTGEALKNIKGHYNVDNLKDALDFHQKDYLRRVSQVKGGGAFAPSGDYAKRYIQGGMNGLMQTSKTLNRANKDIALVKKMQTGARVGTAGAVIGAGAYGLKKIKDKKKEKTALDIVNESFEKIASFI